MSTITTHVLDTARGRPAAGVPVRLDVRDGEQWREVGRGTTDDDGRLRTLPSIEAGTYRLVFDTGARSEFFPEVAIVFVVNDASQHYHVPLLLSPFGYSTYRGS
ncbi:MAG TPA: hydroxyisourate hydrolase [Thermoanaerobaculia bacterium]|nr:hydroxyisourate hydrolase [Thermoanaerobaculia bacterium]